MAVIGASYRGKKSSYTLTKQIGKGGEGEVYEIAGRPGSVAKIYKDEKLKNVNVVELQEKITTMCDFPVETHNSSGKLCLSWPEDILFDGKRFVGYVMPKLTCKKKIFDATRESSRMKMFNNKWTFQKNIAIAYNLAWTVNKVHEKGYIIGDFNPNNIIVDEHGNVTLIDTDSFSITNPITGKLYKCGVGVAEYLAPELQGKNLSRAKFTKGSDEFSLAIHIFNLLMNNTHPFNCINLAASHSSVSNVGTAVGIAEGHYYYVNKPSGIKLPVSAPDYQMLPVDIRALFEKTFVYTAAKINNQTRTSAKEWMSVLFKFYKQIFVECKNGSYPHHYLASYKKSCPWCAVEKASNTIPIASNTTNNKPPVVQRPTQKSPVPANNAVNNANVGRAGANQTTNIYRRSSKLLYILCIFMGLFFWYDASDEIILSFGEPQDNWQNIKTLLFFSSLFVGIAVPAVFSKAYKKANNAIKWLAVALLVPGISMLVDLGLYQLYSTIIGV